MPAAPIVCEIVFKERIADKCLSILFLSLINTLADLFPSFSFTFKNDKGVDNKTDSITEHRKETNKAEINNIIEVSYVLMFLLHHISIREQCIFYNWYFEIKYLCYL